MEKVKKDKTANKLSNRLVCQSSRDRQRGISLIPIVVTVFIFTLLTVNVIIPQQTRSQLEDQVNATANTAEQIIQAALAYRSNRSPSTSEGGTIPSTNLQWPENIQMLVSNGYMPAFTNRTPWGGEWEFVDVPGGGLGRLLKTNTGSVDIARALVRKIGTHASINDTWVLISMVEPVDHYIQNLRVGRLTAGEIHEVDNISTQIVEMDYDPPVHGYTLGDLTVDKTLMLGTSSNEAKIVLNNDEKSLEIQGSVNITTNLTVNNLDVTGKLTAKQIIEDVNLGGSSRRYKKNIQPLEIEANKIFQLQTVSYDYREVYKHYQKQSGGGRQLGLIAEQIDEIIPELAIYQDGQPVNVDYEKLTVVVLRAVQVLKQELSALQAENQVLKEQVETALNTAQPP